MKKFSLHQITTKSRMPVLGLVMGIGLLLIPAFFPSTYHLRIINYATIYVVLAVGFNFILGLTGQISFAHAAFFGIGAYTAALLSVNAGVSFWVTLPLSGLLPAMIAVLLGIPALKLKGHYLAVATIGFGEIIRLILLNWSKVTRGTDGIRGIADPSLGPWVVQNEAQLYYVLLILTALMVLIAWRIKNSKFGRAFMAIRDNEIAAVAMGINGRMTKVMAFALSAFYAGFAGSMYVHLQQYVSPDTFNLEQGIVFLVMVLIGGMGTISGAIFGAVFMTLLPEWLRFLQQYYLILYGIIIVLIMDFMPEGVIGLLRKHAVKKL